MRFCRFLAPIKRNLVKLKRLFSTIFYVGQRAGLAIPSQALSIAPVDDREFVLKYLVTGGDVPRPHASSRLLNALIGFTPSVDVEEGVKAFVDWYRAEIMQSGLRAG